MKILVVDDNPDLAQALSLGFKLEWPECEVVAAHNGGNGLTLFGKENPDLVVLDIAMPGMDGFEVVRRLREISDVPVIMLTVRGEELDKVRALELGADDYLTKPFSIKVLLAHARAVLRRAALPPVEYDESTRYADDYLTVDLKERRITVAGEPVKLTPTEYRLLAYLVQNASQVLTFRQILQNVWGWEYQDDLDYVRVYVWHLRQKLEQDPKNPKYIQTEIGVGYRFEPAV